MNNPRTPRQNAQRILALQQLVKGACHGHEHDVVLSALGSAFRDVALQHPCCADSVVQFCLTLAGELATDQGYLPGAGNAVVH